MLAADKDLRGRTVGLLPLNGPLPGSGHLAMLANGTGLQPLNPRTKIEVPARIGRGEQVERIGSWWTPEGYLNEDRSGNQWTKNIYLDDALGRQQLTVGADLKWAGNSTGWGSGTNRTLLANNSGSSATTYNFNWTFQDGARVLLFSVRKAGGGDPLITATSATFPALSGDTSFRTVWDPDTDSVSFYYYSGIYDDATAWTLINTVSNFMGGDTVQTGISTNRGAFYMSTMWNGAPARTVYKLSFGRLPDTTEWAVDFRDIYWRRLLGSERGNPGATPYAERSQNMGAQYRLTQYAFTDVQRVHHFGVDGKHPITLNELNGQTTAADWPLDNPLRRYTNANVRTWASPAGYSSLGGVGAISSTNNSFGPSLHFTPHLAGHLGRGQIGQMTGTAGAGATNPFPLLAFKLGNYGVLTHHSISPNSAGVVNNTRASFSARSFLHASSATGYGMSGITVSSVYAGGGALGLGMYLPSASYQAALYSGGLPILTAINYGTDQLWSPTVLHVTPRYALATRPGIRAGFGIIDLSRSWHRSAQDLRRYHESEEGWWGIGNQNGYAHSYGLYASSDPSDVPTTYDYAASGGYDGISTSNAYARCIGHELPLSGPNHAHWELLAGTGDLVLSGNDAAFQWTDSPTTGAHNVIGFRPASPWFDFDTVGDMKLGHLGFAIMWVDSNNYLIVYRNGGGTAANSLVVEQKVGGVSTQWTGTAENRWQGNGVLSMMKRQGKLHVWDIYGPTMPPIDTDPYFDTLQGGEFGTGLYYKNTLQGASPRTRQVALRNTGPNDSWPQTAIGPLPWLRNDTGTSTTYDAGTTSLNFTYPTGWEVGDIIFAVVSSTNTTDTFTAPLGWRAGSPGYWPATATDHRTTIFFRKVRAGDTGSATFTTTGAGNMRLTTFAFKESPFPVSLIPSVVRASGTTQLSVASNANASWPVALHFASWIENGGTVGVSGSILTGSFRNAGYPSHAFGFTPTTANRGGSWGMVNFTYSVAAAAVLGSFGVAN